jgi:hypothetical protein
MKSAGWMTMAVAMVLFAMAVSAGVGLNAARAEEAKLNGECYLVLYNESGVSWQVRLEGKPIGTVHNDVIYLKKFECVGDKIQVELYSGSNGLKQELTAIKGPAKHVNPMNKFIWKLE